MGERSHRNNRRSEKAPVVVEVEGAPDEQRVSAVLEWLLYKRGPLARAIQRPTR